MKAKAFLQTLTILVQQHLRLRTVGVALVAVSCAFVVQTKQLDINFAYPVEALLKTVLADDIISTNPPFYRIKL